MSGLDKIVEQIISAAKEKADMKLNQARQQAEGMIQEIEEAAGKESEKIAQEASDKAADIIERARSAAALQRRRVILSAKQQLIDEIINKAKDSLLTMPADKYFELIKKMVASYAQPQNGQIIFSQRDLSRMPADFQQQLNELLSPKGISLIISAETRPVDGGFVLAYGDIEENCTFSSLIDSKHDILQDKIHSFLFA